MATFFDNQFVGRPILLWIVWSLGTLAFIFLLFGMMIDEITFTTIELKGGFGEFQFSCGWTTFDSDPGNQNISYEDDCGSTTCILQQQAGDVWIAFGILACLFTPFLMFGICTDYYSGSFDNKKPIDYFKGCCMLQTWGFTRIGATFVMIFELLQFIAYLAAEECSSEKFFGSQGRGIISDAVNYEFSSVGGPSLVMVIMSWMFLVLMFLFIFYYQYRISSELPTGEKKEAPITFQKYETGKEPEEKPEKAPAPPPMEPTGQAPESGYFKPANDVTNDAGGGEGSNANESAPAAYSTGPPPVPVPQPPARPKKPPPVPMKKN